MNRAQHVREILATRGLTLYGVSRRSAEVFGASSPFYIPHNWYGSLTQTPPVATIYQMLALSHITKFCFAHWLFVFGFNLDVVFGLQLRIPRKHTTILDPSVYDPYAWIPWLVVARAPVAALGAQRDALASLTSHMVSASLGIIDERAFAHHAERAIRGQEVPMVPLLRTLRLEIWLRALAGHGHIAHGQTPGASRGVRIALPGPPRQETEESSAG